MKSKKILIWHDSNGKRVRVIFDNRKLISGLLNAIDNDNLQREDLAYVIAQILRSLSSSSKKVEFRNEKLEDKKLDNERMPPYQNVGWDQSKFEKEGLSDIYNEKSLEPVHNLLSNKTVNAKTTICKLVLSFLSQFFHNRLHLSSQAKDLSTTHLFGNTTNLCNSFRLATSTLAPIISLI